MKMPDDIVSPNHKIASNNKVQNGSSATTIAAKSPPKDANLNHYRPDKQTAQPAVKSTSATTMTTVVQSPTSDNKKEMREQREKRISRELSPLDHRGEPEQEKKSNRRSVSSREYREHSTSTTKIESSRPPCLSGFIYPLISEVCPMFRSKFVGYTLMFSCRESTSITAGRRTRRTSRTPSTTCGTRSK